eukprot:CAMPEP_0202904782 /NCGR_PEP_ID=MMETSP1392-20130828/31070_1 /ASSEMBLY_ACC=CAM_ASM_000868 /TAXON_ID=225041 /ORGANISM="Chlamydomonas chlamydogama, Strain SAG 11-48b" /LENGTH=70 /DNA_ID=CAMNT_0049592591 /DNA_START=345 /DNA_END=558 /DNA_ORIENTATION=-
MAPHEPPSSPPSPLGQLLSWSLMLASRHPVTGRPCDAALAVQHPGFWAKGSGINRIELVLQDTTQRRYSK